MNRRLRLATASGLALLTGAVMAGPAAGDGLPVPIEGSGAGVANPGGSSRYSTVVVPRGTLLVETEVTTGTIERTRFLPGRLTVPVVAYDGSASGLAADGEPLVLIRPRQRFPRERTTLAVVDPRRLRIERRIVLDGDFSFDAISPDGGTIYLIEYVDPRDPRAYQVRAYDLGHERLDPDPIVDPEVAPVTMGGAPQTRAMSPDGIWAYTLYDSQDRGRAPFIHALNTETAAAACILLEGGIVSRKQLWRTILEPSPDGGTLAVVDGTTTLAIVDTETFEVSEPEPEPVSSTGPEDAGGAPWMLFASAAFAIVALGGATIAVRRRRRRSTPIPELDRLVAIDGEAGADGSLRRHETEDDRDWDPVA